MSISAIVPRLWATDTNFSSGPMSGTPTKVDPGAAGAAQGFVPGTPASAAAFNFVLSASSVLARRMLSVLCVPRYTGLTVADTSGLMVACSTKTLVPASAAVVGLFDANGVPWCNEGGVPSQAGSTNVTSITSAVRGLAFNPAGRLVAVGTGGNRSCFSTDIGASWSAGGDLGGSGRYLIWNPTYSRFMALYADHARHSTDGASWTDVTVTGVGSSTTHGMARYSNGNVVTPSSSTGPVMKLSTNGGTSWTTPGVPIGVNITGAVTVAGEGFGEIYCAGVRSTDSAVAVAKSSDTSAAVWTTVASLDSTFWGFTPTQGTIKQCPDTGILFLCAATGASFTNQSSVAFSCSLDKGATWCPPVYMGLRDTGFIINSTAGWSAVGGRIICTDDGGRMYASEGFGTEQLFA